MGWSEAATELRDNILEEHRAGLLLSKLFGAYARRSDASHVATVDALIQLHNEGQIDLLSILDDGIPNEGTDFFLGMMLYCELLPKIEARAEELIPVVRKLVAAGGEDLAANQPHSAFRQWCSRDRAHVDEVLTLAKAGSSDAQALLCFALEAGASLDPSHYIVEAIDAANRTNPDEQLAAVVALGRIQFASDDPAAGTAALALEKVATTAESQNLQLNAFRGAFELAIKAPSTGAVALRILHTLNSHDPLVVHHCAQLLAFSSDGMPDKLVDALLECVEQIDPANTGTVDQLDFGLRQLWVRSDHDRVRRTLEAILLGGAGLDLEKLDSLVHEILTGDREALEDIVVRWFLSGEFELCDNISKIVGRPLDRFEFSIDFSRFALADSEWTFLGRKAVGFFILYPTTAASFLVSLIRHAPTSERSGLIDLLFDPLLLNYAGQARDYCERVAEADDAAATAVKAALERQEHYLGALRSVGEVREIHPSERQRQAEWRRQHDAMNAAYKAAEKRSILASIATRRVLLYGNRSIDYFTGPNKEVRRNEMQLKSISTSVELPRVEIVDPMGLQFQLMNFRSERLPT